MIRGKNWASYLENFKGLDPQVDAFTATATKFHDQVLADFDHMSRINGLLFGEVQSGKTSHTFALIASVADADEGFKTFVYLSTDNVPLQEQTLVRGLQQLSETFEIIDEFGEVRFQNIRETKPCLIVLKKNSRILQKWLDILGNSQRVDRSPIFIVDDEGDAASPNTKVNKDDESEIYKKINSLRELGTSSIFLQVTATPQALFLQQELDQVRPSFMQFFEPGKNYLGGDFYFSKVDTDRNVFVEDNDLELSLKSHDFERSTSLLRCLSSFLVTCIYFKREGRTNANALIHPSVNTGRHHEIALLAREFYAWIFSEPDDPKVLTFLTSAVDDLNRTLHRPLHIADVMEEVQKGFEVDVVEMNSTINSNREKKREEGFNVFVGGNTLGRGVTFPALQTVYYTRQAKVPQADTYWQHSRMFGYDRDKTAIRIFMPLELFILFQVLQESNRKLSELVKSGDLSTLQIVLPRGVKPTRTNVVKSKAYSLLVGGTNYFPAAPNQSNHKDVSKLLNDFDDKNAHEIDIELAKSLIRAASETADWPSGQLIKAIENMSDRVGFVALVGRGRDIGRTGTMLTEQDRKLGESLGKDFVITAYELKGGKDKNWNGDPFWMINVRIPSGYVYHQVN